MAVGYLLGANISLRTAFPFYECSIFFVEEQKTFISDFLWYEEEIHSVMNSGILESYQTGISEGTTLYLIHCHTDIFPLLW